MTAKVELRGEMVRWTLAQSAEALRRSDEALFARFLALPQLADCPALLMFWGMESEPDTTALVLRLMEQGKVIGLPRCTSNGGMEFRQFLGGKWMKRHPLGMLEPDLSCPLLDPREAPLALVPGLCYDRRGYRLGRGGGFYDRFLATYPGLIVGLCRAEQLQDELPIEAHDLPVHIVITERETVFAARKQ